jgi:hypothetical protein
MRRLVRELAMKLFVGVAVFVWLLCGAIGAWMLDDLDGRHWDMIAKGPITLVKAFNDAPPTMYPSQV